MMSHTVQSIITIAIVAAAACYGMLRVRQSLRPKKEANGCGGNCGGQ
jgi:hypothetical protein